MLTSEAPFIAVDKSDNIIENIDIRNIDIDSRSSLLNYFENFFSLNSIKNEIFFLLKNENK